MIDLLRRNPLIAALGVLCAVLAALVIVELATAGASTGRAPVRKAAPAEAKLLPPLAAAPAEQLYPETANRPLWIPTRRPAPAAAVVAASFARGQFILQGVTIAGETKIALLKEKASGRVHRVEKGRDVNGLQVSEIEPDKVTLAQGAEREVVELRVQRPGAPGAPTPGMPGQPAGAAGGPFAPVAAATGAPVPAAVPATPPSPSPFGQPLVAPGTSPGPLAPSPVSPAPPSPPVVANPSQQPVPQQATTAPMTPEELLARRRARRNQSP